ncbi:MAG: 2-oxoacid ferredoxin oxidoreductase, partial [Nitrospirales bacterium]|nr:2-oxoacid ferredoxin oxidoreductase [Nitrospirales bacterium]
SAFQKALEWGDRIPLGVIYRNSRPTFEEQIPLIAEQPLVKQGVDISRIAKTMEEFY